MVDHGTRKGAPARRNARADRRASDIIDLDDCQLVMDADFGWLEAVRHSGRVSEIAGELVRARSADERRQLVHVVLRTIGFDWFCYCRLTRLGTLVNRAQYFHLCSPPGWARRYVDQRYFDIDPRLVFACRHDWPLVWDHAMLSRDSAGDDTKQDTARNERRQRFLDDAHACGMRSGIAFGLVDPRSLAHSVMIFSCANPLSGWISDHVVGQAYAIGLGVHSFLSGNVWWPARPPVLTDLQRRIVDFTATGMSDREIAAQLRMTASNVDYHMRQIRKKYGVLNRVQLAYLAGRLQVT